MTTIAINPCLTKDARRVKSPINQGPAALRPTPHGRGLTRLAVISSLSILLLSGFAAFDGATAGSKSQSISSPYMKISVRPGDTLWSIAEGISPEADRRALVADILEVNDLKSPNLQAGQKIYIPTRP
ncbi:MAG: LysM peptidoglycan-binding domain-containing protein [Actinobacteria bacterium]|nr:LysM peptidoglycan-binding domain-containing protein [Actinomycetota bacterium]